MPIFETRTETLHRLLDDNLTLPAEYASGLTNHLPMALHALDRLGADAQRLRGFFDAYAVRFEPLAPAAAAPPPLADWLAHRGRLASLAALQSTFAEALCRDDAPTVLRHVVPHLMPGIGAAAFHGLLRTAHAYESGHVGELAHGLAYWAARYFELAPPPTASAQMGLEAWVDELVRLSAHWKSDAPLIFLRMQKAEDCAPYRALAGGLALDDGTLAGLSLFAATAYAESGNFTVLHLLTGCRAARVLLPFAGDAVPALGAVVRAFTAGYLASGVAHGVQPLPQAPADWSTLTAAAIGSDDEHVIKLVDACFAEARTGAEALYRQAAARALA